MDEFNIQISKKNYTEKYNDLRRFISYYHQIKLVNSLEDNIKSVLEIGIGNKTVANYLTAQEYEVKTCDFDKNLKPDIVADIRELPIKDDSFDLVMACEVLEHIPWDDVDKALKELKRVSKKYVLISIPYKTVYLYTLFNFPKIQKIFNTSFLSFGFSIPFFFKSKKFDGQHYWEMGYKKQSKNIVRSKFKQYFEIKKEFRSSLNPYHYFFVLEVKK